MGGEIVVARAGLALVAFVGLGALSACGEPAGEGTEETVMGEASAGSGVSPLFEMEFSERDDGSVCFTILEHWADDRFACLGPAVERSVRAYSGGPSDLSRKQLAVVGVPPGSSDIRVIGTESWWIAYSGPLGTLVSIYPYESDQIGQLALELTVDERSYVCHERTTAPTWDCR